MPVVALAGVTKAYENKIAVSDLSLSIEAGQMFGSAGAERGGQNQLHSHDDGHHRAPTPAASLFLISRFARSIAWSR
jgi:ABC-type uncharacterized transport system ATPase subunit